MPNKSNDDTRVGYSDRLTPERQVDTEETIAAILWDFQERQLGLDERSDPLTPEDFQVVAKAVVYHILREFRHDLFDDAPDARKAEEIDDAAAKLLAELDNIARDFNAEEYGLPSRAPGAGVITTAPYDEARQKLLAAIKKAIRGYEAGTTVVYQ